MAGWKDFLVELARKLTPILAFVVLIIVVVATVGANIPPVYQTLIYIVVIGGMVIYAFQVVLNVRRKYGERVQPPGPQPPEQSKTV